MSAVKRVCLAVLVSNVHRLRVVAGATEGFGRAQGGFEPAWQDDTSAANVRLVIWRPIPYPG